MASPKFGVKLILLTLTLLTLCKAKHAQEGQKKKNQKIKEDASFSMRVYTSADRSYGLHKLGLASILF